MTDVIPTRRLVRLYVWNRAGKTETKCRCSSEIRCPNSQNSRSGDPQETARASSSYSGARTLVTLLFRATVMHGLWALPLKALSEKTRLDRTMSLRHWRAEGISLLPGR